MRVSLRGLADITNVNSMLLPELGPNLPGPLQQSGGVSGLAQGSCPSTEQLAGITDCSDPCQAGYGNCAALTPGNPAIPNTPIAAGSNPLNYGNSNIPLIELLAGSASTGTVAGISTQTLLYVGVGSLLLILVLSAGKRR